jgi:hypothetical protein
VQKSRTNLISLILIIRSIPEPRVEVNVTIKIIITITAAG